jgi:hypothetical protein
MKIAIVVVNVAVLMLLSYRLWSLDKSSLKKFFWPALILKSIAGISLGLVYAYYYTVGDTFVYFLDGIKLAELARNDIGTYLRFLWSGDESFDVWDQLWYRQPRAMFLSKVTSVSCILSGENYWIISLHFSFISFLSAWTLTKKIVEFNNDARPGAILAFLFFPSIVFWSSGLIKESIAIAALFFLCFIFLKVWMHEKPGIAQWALATLSLWWLWNLKYYYLAIFLPVAITTLIARYLYMKLAVEKLPLKALLWIFLFLIPLLLVSILHPNFYLERFTQVVVASYNDFLAISEPEDVIHYHSLNSSLLSILLNAPWALFSGLFRPMFFETHTVFQWFIALENLMLLVLVISASTRIKQLMTSKHRLILFSIIIYTVVLCVFLALSTPNFGTLSRYRVGFIPFLVLVLCLENPLISKFMSSKWIRNLVR